MAPHRAWRDAGALSLPGVATKASLPRCRFQGVASKASLPSLASRCPDRPQQSGRSLARPGDERSTRAPPATRFRDRLAAPSRAACGGALASRLASSICRAARLRPPSEDETIENARAIRAPGSAHWNFRILREQQQRTQSLLTVRGPLQQDVAVQPAPVPFRVVCGSGGGGVPGIIGRKLVFCDVGPMQAAPQT